MLRKKFSEAYMTLLAEALLLAPPLLQPNYPLLFGVRLNFGPGGYTGL